MHMTSASWSRITRREDNPTMGRLSSAVVRGMSLCPDNELNGHSGRFNGHYLGLYRHSAIEPTSVSVNSKLGGAVAALSCHQPRVAGHRNHHWLPLHTRRIPDAPESK
jgi:hypothetical protein